MKGGGAIIILKSANFDTFYPKSAIFSIFTPKFDNFPPKKCNFRQISTSKNEKYGEIFSHFFICQGKIDLAEY